MSKINDQSLLFSGGVIDSHMLLSLITYIEGQTGLSISTGNLSLENFDSIERMLAFINANRAAREACAPADPRRDVRVPGQRRRAPPALRGGLRGPDGGRHAGANGQTRSSTIRRTTRPT